MVLSPVGSAAVKINQHKHISPPYLLNHIIPVHTARQAQMDVHLALMFSISSRGKSTGELIRYRWR